jgi:hypothetical protein
MNFKVRFRSSPNKAEQTRHFLDRLQATNTGRKIASECYATPTSGKTSLRRPDISPFRSRKISPVSRLVICEAFSPGAELAAVDKHLHVKPSILNDVVAFEEKYSPACLGLVLRCAPRRGFPRTKSQNNRVDRRP